ncbi:DUF1446-domain-containing protein, partial [Lepidopterella palustris CBS 459.81]
ESEDFTRLSYALIAGHLIECSSYVTGGYYIGFENEVLRAYNCTSLGFPITEIESDGYFVITKREDDGGIGTIATVISQLLYEIKGPLYYDSDDTAHIDSINMIQE